MPVRSRMRTTVKGAVALTTLSLVTGLTAGCGSQREPSNEVVFWTTLVGAVDLKAQEKIVAEFEKANPDIDVKIVLKPGTGTGDATSMITSVRGGTQPDIFLLDRFTVAQYAGVGLLTNLQPFVEADKDAGDGDIRDNYLPFAIDESTYQDDLYALPFDTDARALFYNKDMLAAAGVDPEIMDPKNGPLTLDEVWEIAGKVNKVDEDGKYIDLGFVPWRDEAWHFTWGFMRGAKFFDEENCELTLKSEPAIEATYADFAKWADELGYSKVDTFFATYQPPDAPPAQTPLYTNHLAMIVSGNFQLSGLREYAPDLNIGVTYLPVENEGDEPYSWSGGFAVGIPADAPNAEIAYEFMKFLTGPVGQKIYSVDTQHLPTWMDLLDDPEAIKGQEFFADLLPSSTNRPPLPVGGELFDALTTARDSVLLGENTPAEALSQAYDRVQPQMDVYCPFAVPNYAGTE